MKKNEEEVRNNAITDGEDADTEITAVYAKAEDADTDAEDVEEEVEEELPNVDADDEEDDDEETTKAKKILKEKGLIKYSAEVYSTIPKANKGDGKKLYNSYIKWIAGIFTTLVICFKYWLKSKEALTEKQCIKMQNILQKIAQNAQNTTLGIISGFRFQSNLNIFQICWNWVCSKINWSWMKSVSEFTIFKKSAAPYNNEDANNNLDEYNCKIIDFIRIWNRQYPQYKVDIKQQDKIEKFDAKTFNNLIWFFNEEADKGKEVVYFTRKFYTNFAKKIDTYCFCKGVKVASIVFGCIVVGGVGYCIYAFGWDGFISKISEILNSKSEESTEETKDELFNTEEVEYLY